IDTGGAQARQLAGRVLTPFRIGIEGELLDPGSSNGGVQVVMQAGTPGLAEESRRPVLQLVGTQGLGATALLVTATEQTIDVLLDITLAAAHGLGIAEQEENPCLRNQLPGGNALQQAVEQFDRRGFITVNTGRQQQIKTTVDTGWRGHFQRPK